MTEGFFFAQQTHRGDSEKSGRHKPLQCRRAQPDGRPERAAAPQAAWRKTRNNAAWSDYPRAAVLQAFRMDEGRSVPRASSFNGPRPGLRCGASTFGQDSGAMMVAGGRINVDVGRLRVEAAGSDDAIDRDFSGPAGFTTDWIQTGNASVVVEKAHKKTSAVEEGGGNLLRGIPPMQQKLCPGFFEDANAIDRRDTQDHGDFKRSPGNQWTSDRQDFAPFDRAVATAVEAIGNASRENKEFVVGKTPTGSPDGKRAMSAIFSWRHWPNPLVVDNKPVSKCIEPISRASDYWLENVPVIAVVSGTTEYVTPRRRRNAEVHKFADGRFFRRTQIQTGCDARRCVDDDHPPADDGWKDCPCRNESECDSLEPPSAPAKTGNESGD